MFERHFSALVRFFYNKVDDGIEDLVQETFLHCIEARDRIREAGTFQVFLLRIARNRLYKRWLAIESFGTSGIRYVGTGTFRLPPDGNAISMRPSSPVLASPRWISRTSPVARTTVSASTHGRVEPYLNVAAPAALVAMVPPTNAPSYVGTGG